MPFLFPDSTSAWNGATLTTFYSQRWLLEALQCQGNVVVWFHLLRRGRGKNFYQHKRKAIKVLALD
jgi:hypothetical protein